SDHHHFATRRPLTKSASKHSLVPERNDYSYMLRERHSAHIDTPDPSSATESLPQVGQPYSFHDKLTVSSATPSLHVPSGAAPAIAVNTPSTRQSQASISTDMSTVPMRQSSSQQLASSILKRAGS
ncbi:hypothetical protein GGI05_007756, partial [Coemansia sp. RSA 2603]